MSTIDIPRGATRTYPLRVKRDGVYLDLTAWEATVIVDVDKDPASAPLYGPIVCPLKPGDPTTRLIPIGGAATEGGASIVRRWACVHLVAPDGSPDSIEREIKIVPHA